MNTKTKQKPRRLHKLVTFQKRITKKTSVILAILLNTQYTCHYPDPDRCPNYDTNGGFCMNTNIKCGYRNKL